MDDKTALETTDSFSHKIGKIALFIIMFSVAAGVFYLLGFAISYFVCRILK